MAGQGTKYKLFLFIDVKNSLLFIGPNPFAVLCGMLMTACDVAAIAKPWEQQHELARQVADEFFDQGDMEKLRLNEQPIVSSLRTQFGRRSRLLS